MQIETQVNFGYFEYKNNKEIIFSNNEKEFLEEIINLPKNSFISGFFSGSIKIKDHHYLWRDPLGLSKLYLFIDSNNKLITSKSWIKLILLGADIKKIYALPKGKLIKYENGSFHLIRELKLPIFNGSSNDIANELNDRILGLFSKIKSKISSKDNEFFLALSGGLDSSYLLEKSRYAKFELTSCTVKMPGSLDAGLAKKLSKKINLKHFEIKIDKNKMIKALHTSPIVSEDWRDFNVHCGAINLLIGEQISNKFLNSNKQLFVITGDLMNEYVCDYSSEIYKGDEYYKLPAIPKVKLQKYLINGLSTSSREDVVFSNYGINTIQPYAIVSDLYLGLNEEKLCHKNIKRELNLIREDKWLNKHISSQKLRAQVGNKDTMGMLGLSIENKLNNKTFLKLIAKQIKCSEISISELIFAGNFRFMKM